MQNLTANALNNQKLELQTHRKTMQINIEPHHTMIIEMNLRRICIKYLRLITCIIY